MVLKLANKTLNFKKPVLMGIVNVTPDSFSDAGDFTTLESQIERAVDLVEEGAEIIDIGGESAVTNKPAVSAAEEIERVCPLIEQVSKLGVIVSIDTYKPDVAKAAIISGAVLVNDVSGLRYPGVAETCADSGAGLVIMHTRVEPKKKLVNPSYDDLLFDVIELFEKKIALAKSLGVNDDQIVLDLGPDFAKTPSQTIELLQQLDKLKRFGRPLLLAASRKDFIGALNKRSPKQRLAGTLAAVAFGVAHGAKILRVHDVADVKDFLTVWSVLNSEQDLPYGLVLPDELRWEKKPGL